MELLSQIETLVSIIEKFLDNEKTIMNLNGSKCYGGTESIKRRAQLCINFIALNHPYAIRIMETVRPDLYKRYAIAQVKANAYLILYLHELKEAS